MDTLLEFAGMAGPAIAGLLTVPALQGVKAVSKQVKRAPPTVKQLLGVTIAFGLNKLGAATNSALPGSLELFDGSHTEALISSGIAFGVHAGKKARENAPRLLVLLFASSALLTPATAAGQVARDSVEVDIYAPGDITVEITPATFTGLVGDTVTFEATVIDQVSGDTIGAVAVWSSESDGVTIDPETGHAEFTARGNWRIRVDVERIGGLVIYELLDDGSVRSMEGETLQIDVGQRAPLCVYLTDPTGLPIARSADKCPMPASSPEWAPVMEELAAQFG